MTIDNINNTKRRSWEIQKINQASASIPTPDEVFEAVRSIDDLRIKSLFTFAYLTGGRISELTKGKIKIRLDGSKKYTWIEQGVKKRDVDVTVVDGREIMLINIPNRKHRSRRFKEIPIPIEKEWRFVEILDQYLSELEDDDYLFDFGRIRAYQLIMKNFGINPHFIRHIRLTHLVTYHDLNEQLLVKFAGWSDTRPAKSYMEPKWRDILQKY